MTKISVSTIEEGDYLVKKAVSDTGRLPELYFKFPKSVAHELTERLDPFVHALIFPMMREGGDFEFTGEVSASLLDNLVHFMQAWSMWCPDSYHTVQISAQEVADDYRPDNRKMISAFSGGLDAAYVTYKYRKGLLSRGGYELDKAVMLLGADIKLYERDDFASAFAGAKKMTDDLGIDLIPVETNFRDYRYKWIHVFPTIVLAALEFFSKNYFYGLQATGDTYLHYQVPFGDNPITDNYLTTDTFRYLSVGREHSRTARARLLGEWKAGIENLRVCYLNEDDKSKNCGVCEKCVRTKLNFLAAGVSHLPSMPTDICRDDLLREELISSAHDIVYYREVYDYAQKHNSLSAEWMAFLRDRLATWSAKYPDGAPPPKRTRSLWARLKRHFKKHH